MWRLDPSGPQGPMQVSEAAATDVGGGDRFDLAENRAIGRAYLLQLFWRYKNWPDAIAAYNWGLGKMDAWVKAGRPSDQFLVGVAVYLKRVLHESGLCEGAEAAVSGMPKSAMEGAKEPAVMHETMRPVKVSIVQKDGGHDAKPKPTVAAIRNLPIHAGPALMSHPERGRRHQAENENRPH